MRNWDIREFGVRVNWPSLIRQVRVWIRCVIISIRGLLNPIRHVEPLFSHIRSHPPYRSYLHPHLSLSRPKLDHHRKTRSQVIPLYLSMPWLWVDTKYSIHQVPHTLSTASTQDYLSFLHSHEYELTPECRFSFQCASLHGRLTSASSPWESKGKVTLLHSHGCKLTNWRIDSQHLARRPSTASKYLSNLARSEPPSVSPNSLNHGLQVHLQTRSITASKCISRLAPFRPASSHDHGLQVPLQTRSFTI